MNKQTSFSLVIMLMGCILFHSDVFAIKWTINVQNFTFSPTSLPSVQLGDTIRWVWISGIHTTTSTTIPAGAAPWDQPITISAQTYEYIPAVTGTYNYKCTPHEAMGMVGSFVVAPPPFISLNLKVFLEGPFNSTLMNTSLNANGLLPLSQPFNLSPWNYGGNENVPSIPNPDIVDWVLVELRETNGSASTATPDKMIGRQAAFLKKSGEVVGLNGTSFLAHNGTISSNLFVIIWHRNHLAVMSSLPLTGIGGTYTWDFTDAASKAYLNGQKLIGAGTYGMIGGDSDANGIVDQADKNNGWIVNSGLQGYLNADLNLDIQVNNLDKDDYWFQNLGDNTQVPSIIQFSCGGLYLDTRDGQSYMTIQIGNQCWFMENINIGVMIPGNNNQTNNSQIDKYCYNDLTGMCDTYGGLYQWNEAIQYSTVPGNQGVCPDGCHVPSDAEWTMLTDLFGGETLAGGKLKETGFTHWNSPNLGATNESGFTAIAGGYRFTNGSFFDWKISANFWSSTEESFGFAWHRGLRYDESIVHRNNNNKNYGFSVRCIVN
jgi:uncharacterized protein (TIGR02145 family)